MWYGRSDFTVVHLNIMCERRQVQVSVSKRFMESGAYRNAASVPAARQLLLFNYSLHTQSMIWIGLSEDMESWGTKVK